MSNHGTLCNVAHYTDLQYAEHVPAPLTSDDAFFTDTNPRLSHNANNNSLAGTDIYHGVDKNAILQLRDQMAHLRAGVLIADAITTTTTTNDNDNDNTVITTAPEENTNPSDDAVASRQWLVNAFLAEGMSDVNDGNPYSGYPLYGRKTAEERLDAIRTVMHESLRVDVQLPRSVANDETDESDDMYEDETRSAGAPPAVVVESREQYWRRLARYYIQKGQDVAISTAAVCGVTPFEPEDPFYMIDLGRVVEQMALWRHCLPMVRPHFAVKCNPTLPIMQVLSALGAGFDCASKAEINLVMENQLVDSPDDIVFANPCKQPGDIKAANAAGVFYTTFDNEEELEKLAKYMPNARAILRIATNDSSAKCAFSTKFGARLAHVPALLARAAALRMDIYGVSFHVGSGNNDPQAYVMAIEAAHDVFEQAARYGFNCTLLDIGGGYPGTRRLSSGTTEEAHDDEGEGIAFEAIAAAIRPVLIRLFPNTTIISEPGRFFTAATHAVAMNVFAKRTLRLSEPERARFATDYAPIAARLEAEEKAPLSSAAFAAAAAAAAAPVGLARDTAGNDQDDDNGDRADPEDVEACGASREVSWEEHQYYVNDGLYHSFNCIVFDHAHPRLWLLDDGDGADRLAAANGATGAENCPGQHTRLTTAQRAANAAAGRPPGARGAEAPTRRIVVTTTLGSDSDDEAAPLPSEVLLDGPEPAAGTAITTTEGAGVLTSITATTTATAAEATPHLAPAAAAVTEEDALFSLQQSFSADSFAVRASQWVRQADAEAAARRLERVPRPLRVSTVFGPTCDSLDCILKQQPFPEMQVGDWILAPDMGSYTTAAGCPFNGFATRRRELVCSVKLL